MRCLRLGTIGVHSHSLGRYFSVYIGDGYVESYGDHLQ
jgi:hypothetical protein